MLSTKTDPRARLRPDSLDRSDGSVRPPSRTTRALYLSLALALGLALGLAASPAFARPTLDGIDATLPDVEADVGVLADTFCGGDPVANGCSGSGGTSGPTGATGAAGRTEPSARLDRTEPWVRLDHKARPAPPASDSLARKALPEQRERKVQRARRERMEPRAKRG